MNDLQTSKEASLKPLDTFKIDAKSTNLMEHVQRNKPADQGGFLFDQKFRKFRNWERMEQTFSGISFRNFGCTSRGWPKSPENRNNRKIPFHSTIPGRAQFLRARKSNSRWLPLLLLNMFLVSHTPKES